jgi:hypothetical protein
MGWLVMAEVCVSYPRALAIPFNKAVGALVSDALGSGPIKVLAVT